MTNTVLITGCSSGFGLATAAEFARQGWNVVATMRSPVALPELSKYQNVAIVKLDVENVDSIQAAIDDALARFGALDVLVNNAGFAINSVFEALPQSTIHEMFDVNVFGLMSVTRAVLPHFRARRSGVIVNVSSGAGVFGLPLASIYNATKFAIEGFSEALSYELKGLGISVKIVEPGAAPTTSFPNRSRAASPELVVPVDYKPFIAHASTIFSRFRNEAHPDAIGIVARGIVDAAQDTSERMRYVLTDDIKPLIAARRESSEADFQRTMQTLYGFRKP